MSRKAFLPFHSAAATTTPKNTAAGRRGPSTFRSVAAALPSLSPRDGRESGQPEFLLRFFGLKQEPFPDAPDDGFCYTNAAIRQIYRELINVLAERPGIAVLTGEAGTGKTILIRRLCSELRASGHLVIGRCRGGLVFDELIAAIAEELKILCSGEDRVAWPPRFRAALERNKGAPPPVLVIDDAERLGGDVVANLAQLLAGPADCSLRILLCGRPELATRLELPGLAELKRMISVVCRLERMSDGDAASYIFHRLRRAGYRGTTLFSAAAINTVVAKAAGLPRRINRVCARSLTVAAAAGRPAITSEMVEEAVTELMQKDASPIEAEHDPAPPRHRAAIAGSMGASIVAAGIVLSALMGREQAPELVGIVSALHAMMSSREGAAVTRQAVVVPLEGDGVLPERRSGSAEPIQLRLAEAPQLKQAVQWAFDEAGALSAESSPQPAALERASPNLLQPADPCREAQEICSNLPDGEDRGDTADGGPTMPAGERPGENREEVKSNSVAGTEPTAQAEQRSPVSALISRAQSQLEAGHIADPAGDNAVETYRQLFSMGAEPAQANELLEQIRLALWASARSALRAGKWEEARRFYELAVHPAIDIEDAEPLATAAIQEIDTEVAAAPEPVLPRDAAQGARTSDGTGPSMPPEMGKTKSLDQPKPGQASDGAEAVDGKGRSAAPPQAGNPVEAVPAAGASGPAQAADTGGQPVGASAMPEMSKEDSLAAVAAGPAQQAHSEGAGNSGSSTPPEASLRSSVAPAAVPAVMMPAAAPMPAETIAALIKRGDELLGIGDISAARLAYERAAAGGSARAMTALGMTYDPSFLNRTNARGIRPDPAMAAEWYRKAAALGDAAAAARISQLPALAK